MRHWRGTRHALLILALAALGACRDAFTTDVPVVARAGTAQLTVDRLGELFARGKMLSPTRDVVERVTQLWVDYSLYAQRVAAGDSLLDSTTVVSVLWPEVQQRLADYFHENLVAERVRLDSAMIDSIYQEGELRLLRHILVRTEPAMAPPQRATKRRNAEAIRARLAAGQRWAVANRSNEDTQMQSEGGVLGVVARGDLLPQIEDAAFSLEPGGLSPVVESPAGYHVINRPRLEEMRAEFAAGVETRMVAAFDSIYQARLPERRRLEVKSGASAVARAAIGDLVRSEQSDRVLGTFQGGRFTVADLVRWVQAMPPNLQQQVLRADDAQLTQLLRQLMRNQAMMVEADSAGARLTAIDVEEFRTILRRDLGTISSALGLDSLPADAPPDERRRLALLKVDQYLDAMTDNRAKFVGIPPFLATRLRADHSWRIVPAGIERALDRARVLRAAIDSARAGAPPASPVPLPNGDSGASNAN